MNTILVIGSSLQDKGGIATVMKNIEESFLKEKFKFVHITTYKTTNNIKKLLIYIVAIFRVLLSIKKCKIAHIHMSYKGSFYRKSIIILLLKIFNKPVIIHMHGSCFKEFYNGLNGMTKKYCKFIFNKADKVIVLSESWKKFFVSFVEKDKVFVMHNNVPIKEKLYNMENKRENKVYFLFLGRQGNRKGIYDLLDVSIKLKQTHKEKFKLIIAGDGEIEKVNQIIKKSDLMENVENVGWIDGTEKEHLLEVANVFVLPSYNEGLPMAILEAMSYHIPCIATKVGGIPEVIENEKNGFLITPGNKDELYNAMNAILVDSEKIEKMGKKAFETVESRFNEEKELIKLEGLYYEMIKGE